MSLEERKKKCPRCGAVITFYPAISRKDNKTEICSDCGVIEAIEEYINHKNKLEVGMYVRLNCNYEIGIGKTIGEIDEDNFIKAKFKDDFECSLPTYMITKASHNIIDLIEVGDYVNGVEVIDVDDEWITMSDTLPILKSIANGLIKSILTKQQFESMNYKLED